MDFVDARLVELILARLAAVRQPVLRYECSRRHARASAHVKRAELALQPKWLRRYRGSQPPRRGNRGGR
eukprot:4830675-Pyramimonas_sp.AAC.1